MDINYNEQEDMEQAQIKQQYDYYSKERKNFSLETDKLMEKVKKGTELTDDEVFLLTTDQQWIEEHSNIMKQKQELTDIKSRIKDGTISQDDFNYLTDTMGLDQETKENMLNEFRDNGIINNEGKQL